MHPDCAVTVVSLTTDNFVCNIKTPPVSFCLYFIGRNLLGNKNGDERPHRDFRSVSTFKIMFFPFIVELRAVF